MTMKHGAHKNESWRTFKRIMARTHMNRDTQNPVSYTHTVCHEHDSLHTHTYSLLMISSDDHVQICAH